jgi:hypothetical protein
MTISLSQLLEESFCIAWDYLERTGELGDGAVASRFISGNIEAMIRKGCLARLHLKPMKFDREAVEADPLIAIAGGGGVNLFNSQGNAWTADYLKITGELDVDLRSNIAAEARAKR